MINRLDSACGRVSLAPTLAEVVADPDSIACLSPAVVVGLVIQVAALQQQLGARLAVAGPVGAAEPAALDELLDTAAAARRLGVSKSTLAHGVDRMPYSALVVPTGSRRRRFSAQRIAAWLRGELETPGTRRASALRAAARVRGEAR